MRFQILLCSTLVLLAGCGVLPQKSGGDILVIGDSVMAWNGSSGRDVGDVLGAELNREVVNRAVLGAKIQAGAGASLLGLNIPSQLSAGDWNWVVMNGGANDLANSCGCGDCSDEIEDLISANGTKGEIPALIGKARSQGARVMWMGYYEAPQSPSFKNCRAGLVELERRIAVYANAQEGVYFVDSEEVIVPANLALYAADRAHPSPAGSAVLGAFLAKQIGAFERR